MGTRVRLGAIAALAAALAACSGGGSDTTTTVGVDETSAATATTTSAGIDPGPDTEASTSSVPTITTTATTVPLGLPEYTILSRSEEDELVVLLEPATYSDIDLQNVVTDVVERFAPVVGLHLVDDADAAELVVGDRTDLSIEQRDFLSEHYFLRLEEGFRMIYLGPFEDVGEVILGS